jgi:glucose-6-phosphate isomerase
MAKSNVLDDLGENKNIVIEKLAELREHQVISRIWEHDYFLWNEEPAEISNRLGWLHIATIMRRNINRLMKLRDRLVADKYKRILILGMGGSSLAPEVFYNTFGEIDQYPDLTVLDSTDPDVIMKHAERIKTEKTLFIVSTKSGSTVETVSFFKFFYNKAQEINSNDAGKQFIAITDSGTKLVDIAEHYGFREIFLNDTTIGGRYSALSYFGLVPAALIGADVKAILRSASEMMEKCHVESYDTQNPAVWLGAVMGSLALNGKDKLTLVTSPEIAGFGAWLEQLIAESMGKGGKGILPVDGEKLDDPGFYGDDRLFVYLKLKDDDTHDANIQKLKEKDYPVIPIEIEDKNDLGGEFFRWEMATAVAGHILGVNPFNQPNVESAKVSAREMTAAYQETGKLPELTPTLEEDGITVYANLRTDCFKEAINDFFSLRKPKDYIAIQAYVQPTDETDKALQDLRLKLRNELKLATTVGYGPRFLHSTGQLHKGDAGNGLFIQITSDSGQHVPIPDEAGLPKSSIDFGTLKLTQALGDRRALLDAGRRFIRFHLGDNVISGLRRLTGVEITKL